MDKHQQSRYTDRLLAMQKRLAREVNAAEDALREDVVAPGDISTVPTHPADFDSENLDAQIAIAENEEQLLEQVVAALDRIAVGTFGICQECGREIARQRLDAIPYTSWCIDCAARHDASSPRRA
jgi:RNA polymerase-binding protein DksA